MKIEKITLKNFRNHKDTTIDFDDLTVILGVNGGGKSSIRAAIEYLLTGRVYDWTDKRGSGSTDLISYGKKEMSVEAVIGGKTFRRSTRDGFNVDGLEGSTSIQEKIVFDRLGVSPDQLSAVLNTSDFINLPMKEQKEMLFASLGGSFTPAMLLEELAKTDNGKGYYTDLIELFPDTDPLEPLPPDCFDKLFREAYEQRKHYNKQTADLETKINNASEAPVSIEGLDPQKLEAARLNPKEVTNLLRTYQSEMKALLIQSGVIKEAQRQKEVIYAEIAELKKEAKKLVGGKKPAEQEDLAPDLKKAQTALDDAQEALKASQDVLDEATKVFERAAEHEATLKAFKTTCPILDIDCPVDKKDVAKAVKAATAATKTATIEQGKALKEWDTLKAYVDQQEADLQVLKNSFDTTQMVEANEKKQHKLFLEGMKLETNDEKIVKQVEDLEDRIKEGTLIQTALAIDEGASAGFKKELAEARHHQVNWSMLVDLFGPDGIRTDLLLKEIEGLNDEMREAAHTMFGPGKTLEITADPFQILLNGVPLKQLSTSERARVGQLFQVFLAETTGLMFMIMDDVEILRGPDKDRVMAYIAKRSVDLDTTIIIASADEKPVPNGSKPQKIWVEAGVASVIK